MYDESKLAWKGWEYVDEKGLHMIISKRHLFLNNIPVCGCNYPTGHSNWLIMKNAGRGQCKKCLSWESKNRTNSEL